MSKKNNPRLPLNDSFTDFLLYTTPNGKVKVEIFLRNETVWLTQDKIAQLFGVQRPAITKHLKNIFESGELQEELVSSILEHTTQHGAIEGKTQSTASQTQIHQKPSTEFQNTEIEEDVIWRTEYAKLSWLLRQKLLHISKSIRVVADIRKFRISEVKDSHFGVEYSLYYPIVSAVRTHLNRTNTARNNDLHEMHLFTSALRSQLNQTILESQGKPFLSIEQKLLGEINKGVGRIEE